MYTATSIVLAAVLGAGAPALTASNAPAGAQASAAATLTDAELRAQVYARLGAIDTPVPASAWQALGPRAEPILRELVENRDALPSRRAKALDGLAAVGAGAALFRDAARAESEPLIVRMAALRGLGQATAPHALAAELAPVLAGAADSRVRAYAAEVLVHRGGPAACLAVRAQVATENEAARRYFERALSRCAAD